MEIAGNIVLVLGNEEINLHPSLRCAMNLANRVGGLRVLVRDLLDMSVTAAVECIEPHCDFSREYLIELMMATDLNMIRFDITEYVMQCAAIDTSIDNSVSKKEAAPAENQSYPDFYLQLYRYGTGWLGWTPEQTLDATPFEIIEAHKGRMEMLRAIFGGGEKQGLKDDRPLDEKFRSVLAAIGTQKAA